MPPCPPSASRTPYSSLYAPFSRTLVPDFPAYPSTPCSSQAKDLVHDLEWLNTDFYERWRTAIFTADSPVSWRWKAGMRLIFAICFAVAAWLAWIALRGAYRAHRQRLVWGERLMY